LFAVTTASETCASLVDADQHFAALEMVADVEPQFDDAAGNLRRDGRLAYGSDDRFSRVRQIDCAHLHNSGFQFRREALNRRGRTVLVLAASGHCPGGQKASHAHLEQAGHCRLHPDFNVTEAHRHPTFSNRTCAALSPGDSNA